VTARASDQKQVLQQFLKTIFGKNWPTEQKQNT